MAGLFKRIKNFFASEVNSALGSVEDPMKLFELNMTKLIEQMGKVEKEAAVIIANREVMKNKVEASADEAAKYDGLARSAAAKKDEEALRAFLEQKHRCEAEGNKYQELYDNLDQSAKKAEKVYNTLKLRVEDLNTKRSVIRAKLMAADAQEAINKINNEFTGEGAVPSESIEEVADRKLIAAEAVTELRGDTEGDKLKEYEAMYTSASADIEKEMQQYLADASNGKTNSEAMLGE